jgi:ComF family protein
MILRTAKKALTVVLDLAYPRTCAECGATVTAGEQALPLCPECMVKAELSGDMMCPRCGAGISREPEDVTKCPKCYDLDLNFRQAVSLAPYERPLGAVVKALKFRGQRYYARPLAEHLAAVLRRQDFTQKIDLIIPVPIHWLRKFRRGFNQSELIARRLGPLLNIPVDCRSLRRTRNTTPQTKLSGSARRQNLKGAFKVRRPDAVAGKRILLLDDVMTTGGTMTECARALRRAGAKDVYAAVVAR